MKRMSLAALALLSVVGALPADEKGKVSVEEKTFGKMPDGTVIRQFTLKNKLGTIVKIINYGGIITELHVADKNGKMDDVLLGFDNLEAYLKGHPYFGAIIGRYGNRIAKGRFTLNGVEYKLAVNNGENHLHGGIKGFDKVVWNARPLKVPGGTALELTYLSLADQ